MSMTTTFIRITSATISRSVRVFSHSLEGSIKYSEIFQLQFDD